LTDSLCTPLTDDATVVDVLSSPPTHLEIHLHLRQRLTDASRMALVLELDRPETLDDWGLSLGLQRRSP